MFGGERFCTKPCNPRMCSVAVTGNFSRTRTGASRQGDISGDRKCALFQLFIHVTARVTLLTYQSGCPCYISFTLSAITIWHLCKEGEFCVLCSASSLQILYVSIASYMVILRKITKISIIALNPIKMMQYLQF